MLSLFLYADAYDAIYAMILMIDERAPAMRRYAATMFFDSHARHAMRVEMPRDYAVLLRRLADAARCRQR